MPKVHDKQGNYLHDAEPMPAEFITPTADERLAALEDELRDVKGRLTNAERRKP